ncbi:MAG: 4-hydroxy-tetrahydrodipicolinate synthase [Oscillospiraceae bacterium]|nr:4-hydroxy-tetrahydrodipicolinate synthase [Oscillospiraceae bacterium]
MKQPVFTGVCTALVTPFLNGKINYPLMEQLLRRQIDAGIGAVVLSGTTGEAPTLSDEEKITMFYKAKEYAGDSLTIIAGTGTNSTSHAVELSKQAQQVGADALLVVTPYYNKGNPDGLYRHYAAVANAVSIPIIVYNVPSRTGVDMPPALYAKISKLPNIAGVKEASNDVNKITKIRCMCPKDFYIWTGNDDLIVPVMSMGGVGVISVLSNIFPEETAAMADAALDGDFDTAAHLQCQLSPFITQLFAEVNPIPVKYAMKYAGFDCGDCRLPLGQISPEIMQKIDRLFK